MPEKHKRRGPVYDQNFYWGGGAGLMEVTVKDA